MSNPLWEWWKLASSASEIAWYSPQVVQKRTQRLLAAPTLTRTADRKEATRMVAEKLQAAQEAQWALWQQSLAMQQRMWTDLWSSALAGRSPNVSLRRAGRRGARDAAVLAQHVLAPVRRRVKANVRRLRAHK
jgi:S-formylglutathione hydrolase FrmB